ncbi:MAG: hypothetical protein JO328_19445 [Hyphomicrobiales bacterium]|nr:hypothetical protein [Hyphomicrobiales bacterium]MBV8825750.1 hypothetical protein [Hyphomicrobiales bacterium]
MIDEIALTKVLTEIGYSRLKRHVYRANWSTPDVEHLVYFSLYGAPKDFLTADFGLKNMQAEIFAIREITKYGGEVYQGLQYDEQIDTFMRFSLGIFASWGLRESIRVSAMTGAELAKKIRGDMDEKLFPIIRNVRTLNDLLSVLLLDVEPFPWVRCNGAIRAGEVVDLARRLGMNPSEIRTLLKPFSRWIRVNLAKAPDPDPDMYVERLIHDSSGNGSAC